MARQVVRDERRAQILDALYAVVATRGTIGASITEIAEQAGVARGALHYFFESKDEITASLMRRLGNTYVEHLSAYLARRSERATRDAAARATLVADITRYHFAGDADDALRRITVWIDYWGQAASQPAIRDVILEIQEGARALIARALIAQRPELERLDDVSLRAHSAALLGLIEGGLLQWRFAAHNPALAFDRRAFGDALAASAHAIAETIPTVGLTADGAPLLASRGVQ